MDIVDEIIEIFRLLSPEDRLEALAFLAALVQEDTQDTTAASPDSPE